LEPIRHQLVAPVRPPAWPGSACHPGRFARL